MVRRCNLISDSSHLNGRCLGMLFVYVVVGWFFERNFSNPLVSLVGELPPRSMERGVGGG